MKDVSKDVANSASSLAAPLSVLATDQLGWLTSVTPSLPCPHSQTSTAQLLIKTNSALPSIDWLSARNGLRVTRIVFRLKRR